MAEVETTATHEFHVKCVYRKEKMLKLDDRRRYKEKILSLFSLPAEGHYQIRLKKEEINEWVDVDDWHELPDTGGKLKITVRSGGLGRLLYFI